MTPAGHREGTEHDERAPMPGVVDGHSRRRATASRRVSPSRTRPAREAVPQVRSARLPRYGHRHRGGRHEVDVGARLPRAREPHRRPAPAISSIVGTSAKVTPARWPGAYERKLTTSIQLLERAERERDGSTGLLPARRSTASPSAASGSTARGPTTPTTSCPTRIGASCAGTASSQLAQSRGCQGHQLAGHAGG